MFDFSIYMNIKVATRLVGICLSLLALLVAEPSYAWQNNLASLRALVAEKNSVAEVMNALPEEFRRNIVVLMRSGSLQEASCSNPRFISFSSDGMLSLTANGHPSQEGFEAIEAREFDPKTSRFNFEEMIVGGDLSARLAWIKEKITPSNFDEEKARLESRPFRTGVNSDVCTTCHSPSRFVNRDLRDNWTSYNSWPAAMFGRDDRDQEGLPGFNDSTPYDSIFNPQRFSDLAFPSTQCVKQFTSNLDSPRYLPIASTVRQMTLDPSFRVNAIYTSLVMNLNAKRIARIIMDKPNDQRDKIINDLGSLVVQCRGTGRFEERPIDGLDEAAGFLSSDAKSKSMLNFDDGSMRSLIDEIFAELFQRNPYLSETIDMRTLVRPNIPPRFYLLLHEFRNKGGKYCLTGYKEYKP